MNVFFVGANAEYGWPKSTASSLLAIFSLSAGPGFLMLGWLIGRYGIRKPSLLFAVGYAATILVIPHLPPIHSVFVIDFLFPGFLGASACAMPFAIAITASFDRRRGLALGLGAAGAGFGSAVTVLTNNACCSANEYTATHLYCLVVCRQYVHTRDGFLLAALAQVPDV